MIKQWIKENEQELYGLIIEKLWNPDEITNMQKKFFDNKFEGGTKLYESNPEVWKKRGLTYVDKGKLWKVWFNDEEIDKLVDMTNRGFGEFNPSLTGHHKEKGGPFGIKLHSWDAIPQSNEVSKLIWKKLEKYREAVQTKSHEDELRKLEEPIIDLCIRSAWRLSFIDERKSVKLDWKDGEARKSALWVRAFLGDGEVDARRALAPR